MAKSCNKSNVVILALDQTDKKAIFDEKITAEHNLLIL